MTNVQHAGYMQFQSSISNSRLAVILRLIIVNDLKQCKFDVTCSQNNSIITAKILLYVMQ